MEIHQHTMRLQWTPWSSMGLPWNSTKVLVVSMVPHGTPWSFHETPWNSMELPWSSMGFHGASMELHVIPWSFHGTPWGFHRIPWNSMKLHGILWNSMEFHGIPWSYFTREAYSSVGRTSSTPTPSSAPTLISIQQKMSKVIFYRLPLVVAFLWIIVLIVEENAVAQDKSVKHQGKDAPDKNEDTCVSSIGCEEGEDCEKVTSHGECKTT